jgi:hypothetical protein
MPTVSRSRKGPGEVRCTSTYQVPAASIRSCSDGAVAGKVVAPRPQRSSVITGHCPASAMAPGVPLPVSSVASATDCGDASRNWKIAVGLPATPQEIIVEGSPVVEPLVV